MIEEYVNDTLFNSENEFYDLKEEFHSILHLCKSDSNIMKFKKYDSYNPVHNKDKIDCDVCELAVFTYYNVWDFLRNGKLKYGRPTRQYNKTPYYIRNYKYQIILVDNKDEYYRGDTMTSFKVTFSNYKKVLSDGEIGIEIDEEIEKFAKLVYTIGNMIPIPSYFNGERAGKYATADFWDLGMQQIKKWYSGEDEALELLLNPDKENKNIELSLKCCKKWLAYFGDWNNFVESNFLSSFVEQENGKLKKDENRNYIPIMFWAGHSYIKRDVPTDPSLFLSYLKTINNEIESRNIEILDVLKKQLRYY